MRAARRALAFFVLVSSLAVVIETAHSQPAVVLWEFVGNRFSLDHPQDEVWIRTELLGKELDKIQRPRILVGTEELQDVIVSPDNRRSRFAIKQPLGVFLAVGERIPLQVLYTAESKRSVHRYACKTWVHTYPSGKLVVGPTAPAADVPGSALVFGGIVGLVEPVLVARNRYVECFVNGQDTEEIPLGDGVDIYINSRSLERYQLLGNRSASASTGQLNFNHTWQSRTSGRSFRYRYEPFDRSGKMKQGKVRLTFDLGMSDGAREFVTRLPVGVEIDPNGDTRVLTFGRRRTPSVPPPPRKKWGNWIPVPEPSESMPETVNP